MDTLAKRAHILGRIFLPFLEAKGDRGSLVSLFQLGIRLVQTLCIFEFSGSADFAFTDIEWILLKVLKLIWML